MTDAQTSPDPTRKFRCPACGAQMTYGPGRCDACGEEAPIYNRRGFWMGLWLCLGLTALAGAGLLILG